MNKDYICELKISYILNLVSNFKIYIVFRKICVPTVQYFLSIAEHFIKIVLGESKDKISKNI